MNELFSNPEVIRVIATAAAGGTLAAFGAAMIALNLKYTIKQAQQVRFYFSRYYPTIREQVDQNDDLAIKLLDRVLDHAMAGNWNPLLSGTLTAILDRIGAALKAAQEKQDLQGTPPVEVAFAPEVPATPANLTQV